MTDKEIKELLEKKFTFFQHKECEFFPCHNTSKPEKFNCLFCYCPLYALGSECGGNFRYTENGFKDCSGCMFPHVHENYPKILDKYDQIVRIASEHREPQAEPEKGESQE